MFIHSVLPGDTLFKIARKYSVSPIKIIENNDLENPDLLSVGEQLLILTPTRTYTARGGDTVSKIARRFGVKRSQIYANNPYLCGQDRIYPSEVLAIHYDAPPLGAIASNGYCFSGYDEDLLRRALPYLTYLTVAAARADDFDRLGFLFDDTLPLALTRESGKIPLMRVFDSSDHAFYSDKERAGFFIDMLISLAKERGYRGIALAAQNARNISPKVISEFLLEMRKRMIGSDLILFTELDLNSDSLRTDLADACVLTYSKCHLDSIPSFSDGERRVLTEYAECYESTRAFVDLSSFASDGVDNYLIQDAIKRAHKLNRELKNDAEKKILSFDYPHFHGAHHDTRTMRFESLENIKAKLELVAELGYMGVSFDVSRTPASTLMLINTLFSRQDLFTAGYDDM